MWGLLPDREILKLCERERMIEPFVPRKVGFPSWGLSSFGYDVRLGHRFLRQKPLDLVEPVRIDRIEELRPYLWEEWVNNEDIVIHPGETLLCETVEYFRMPFDVAGLCFGKSTWARLGILVNATPLEPAWEGVLVLEITNLSRWPIALPVGKGIAQIVFFRGAPPTHDYVALGGRYQNQDRVIGPKEGAG